MVVVSYMRVVGTIAQS